MLVVVGWIAAGAAVAAAQTAGAPPVLPARNANAPGGTELLRKWSAMSQAEREENCLGEILAGNVPVRCRTFLEVPLAQETAGVRHSAVILVLRDYLAVGSDADFCYTPLSPSAAQRLADKLDCQVPTPRMVDAIYRAAAVKLRPQPLPPGPEMTTAPVFLTHSNLVREQLAQAEKIGAPDGLIAGSKKDVVVSALLQSAPGKVAIYGWHRKENDPIQPLHAGHTAKWVDYSHGIRLVRRDMLVDGAAGRTEKILTDPVLHVLLSGEGPLQSVRCAAEESAAAAERSVADKTGALLEEIRWDAGVRLVIDQPALPAPGQPLRVALFAVPNGNSIEQTAGKTVGPNDDWHFGIQHIRAQTRWLRKSGGMPDLIVVYLENTERAWPAWRKKRDPDNAHAGRLLDLLRRRFQGWKPAFTLTGHSGGGALVFALLDSAAEIPSDVERIAFLDSNYAYDPAKGHAKKLISWLQAPEKHFLTVIAYEDHLGRLNGKPFVSESGGAWGRSMAMKHDLAAAFAFTESQSASCERFMAAAGRIGFYLKRNPEGKILHTVQVERNGFIHALLAGTAADEKGYAYLGDRVYDDLIPRGPDEWPAGPLRGSNVPASGEDKSLQDREPRP
jgi:hypothetical protein